MSKEILNLEPKLLWKHFYSLTQIPRPSKHEDQIQDFMYKFGKDLGLETIKDEVGNIIIKKPATPGMEDRKTVVLQGHLDMVPQKNSDKNHDFTKDPIEAVVDGEWVTATGTTLGADNGMGVAAAMAILEATDIEHPAVEALFTADEETGMTGANGLKPGILNGDILINMDSEDEGELYIGCAGGIDANISFEFEEQAAPANTKAYKLSMTGLKGGHSGMDIILYRGNSNILLARFLRDAIINFDIKIGEIAGGDLRNAIPRESFVTILVPKELVADFEKSVKETEKIYKSELSVKEPDLRFIAEATDAPVKVMGDEYAKTLINAVYATPNGVIRMSDDMEGMVETSTNLAIVKTEGKSVKVKCLLRSAVETAKDALAEQIKSVWELAGAEIEMSGAYPGWKPNPSSEILETMKSVYNKEFGRIPELKAIHAGLECGILGSAYPNWDMISFGPTIRYPHSPDEKVNIETVDKFYKFLVYTLKETPKK
jgi:dipeptidase D